MVFSTIYDLMPDGFHQIGQILTELEDQLKLEEVEGKFPLELNIYINTHRCYGCPQSHINQQCIDDGEYCIYKPLLHDNQKIKVEGMQLLGQSIKLKCLSNLSNRPFKSFFRYV